MRPHSAAFIVVLFLLVMEGNPCLSSEQAHTRG